ncbi:CLUMA_CG016040, isoform A [Clunio marinus]|uniref:CLUMA_CG016040, isoform A n=1 Tax=Clunio marinus TaxID=568069 RepID=A0A1J1IWJ6_9DIPT|nr:CLUMA_CG016040, isoform A [Clunio marinus]
MCPCKHFVRVNISMTAPPKILSVHMIILHSPPETRLCPTGAAEIRWRVRKKNLKMDLFIRYCLFVFLLHKLVNISKWIQIRPSEISIRSHKISGYLDILYERMDISEGLLQIITWNES